IPERHFFRKPAHAISFAERTHHLHMMERGHIQWETHQLFRDYLRTHPEALAAYEQLKRDLALQFSDDRFAYTDAKADFITATIEKARAEKTDPGRVSATDL
ncbi:MAG: GrpB family protein, partial [Ktedonobacteraceae bacterium]|nr:GrpB family protein [Ktedonobacteraceae bacterium]